MNADRTLNGLLALGRDDAVAIAAHEAQPLTYEGLRALIERTCATLNDLGIGLGDRVAIVLPNGPEMRRRFFRGLRGDASAPLNPAISRTSSNSTSKISRRRR
jgi:non-ribosomal peptide synthetase component E (peptide arylation enzyme)